MKQEVVLLIACLIELATTTTETANVVNESLSGLLGEELSDSKQVMATTDGLFRIFTTATSLSLYFFKYLFGFIFRVLIYVISPFVWTIKFCWHQFVTKPFDLLLYVLHVLYPVLMFCLAAICCGIFIGGCAGFAAEAFSSILISATWGPQPLVKHQEENEPQQEEEEEEEEPPLIPLPTNNFMETEDEDEEEPFHQKQKKKWVSSRSSSISSFFSTPTPSKGKEPARRPFIDQWRDSFSSATSFNPSTSSSSNVNPVLIRRMKLSSTESDRPKVKSRTNSWEWDEDDE